MASGGELRLRARFDELVWRHALAGFTGRRLELAAASRRQLEETGAGIRDLRRCDDVGPDGTRLTGCLKLYLPHGADRTSSEQAYGFVFLLDEEETTGEPTLVFIAFGLRHPRPGVRSVYERAHRQLHGRFPN